MISKEEILEAIQPAVMEWIQQAGLGITIYQTLGATDVQHDPVTVSDTPSIDFTLVGQLLSAAVIPGGVNHNSLANLATGDVHTQYLTTGRHDLTTRHTLGTVVPHDDHGALSGLLNDHHTIYLNVARHDVIGRHPYGTVIAHDDHAQLINLTADTHLLYLTNGRHDTTTRHGATVVDHGSIGGLGDVADHPGYLCVDGSRDVAGTLQPDGNNTRGLGSSTRRWQKGWLTDLSLSGAFEVGAGAGAMAGGAGSIRYSGLLEARRGTAYCSGLIYVPIDPMLISSAFNGNSFSDVTTSTEIPLAASLGVTPAVVDVQIIAEDSGSLGTTGLYVSVGRSSTVYYDISARPIGGNLQYETRGFSKCDANGSVWYRINASGTNTMKVWIRFHGFLV